MQIRPADTDFVRMGQAEADLQANHGRVGWAQKFVSKTKNQRYSAKLS
jgi:hypothetical protein